jgi:hypothetical protein
MVFARNCEVGATQAPLGKGTDMACGNILRNATLVKFFYESETVACQLHAICRQCSFHSDGNN